MGSHVGTVAPVRGGGKEARRQSGRIRGVPETDAPAELVALKLEFLTTDAELAALARTLPSSMAIAGGEADFTEDQRATWDGLQATLGELAVQIHRHPAFEGLSGPDRLKAEAGPGSIPGSEGGIRRGVNGTLPPSPRCRETGLPWRCG